MLANIVKIDTRAISNKWLDTATFLYHIMGQNSKTKNLKKLSRKISLFIINCTTFQIIKLKISINKLKHNNMLITII